MSLKKAFFAILAITSALLIAGSASAYTGATVHWGPGNVYMEVYKDSGYYYTSSPFVYYGNHYYYFPYNFRYYYNSQWSYYSSGWYYYNGTVWHPDNSWAYYGTYWYQPAYGYYYYPSTIISAEESSNAYCSSIDIAAYPVIMKEGEAGIADFEIENSSDFTFDISDVKIVEADSEIETRVYSFDNFIPENGSATLSIYISAPEDIGSKTSTAYLKIEGYFPSPGKQCAFSEISESFQMVVNEGNDESREGWSDSGRSSDSYGSTTASFTDYSEYGYGDYYYDSFNSYSIEDSYNTYYGDYYENGDSETASFEAATACSNIVSYTKRFFLGENDSRTQYFTVKNNADKAFYIESIQAFDDSASFQTTIGKPSKTSINAFGTINVPVTVESFGNSLGKQASGTFTVSGVFEDNSYCSDTMIGNTEFLIQTAEPEPESPQGTVTIFYPERIEVPKEGTAFTLTILNTTGREGYIKVSSDSAIVDPVAVVIPAGEQSINATITVRDIDKNAGWVFFDFFMPEYSIQSKVAKIVKPKLLPQPSPGPSPSPIPQPEIPEVQISTEVFPQIDGSYDLNITIDNQSEFPVSGTVSIGVPEEWNIKGDTKVVLGEFEKKTVMLSLAPKESNEKDLNTVVSFRTSKGYVFSEPITLKANRPAFAAMFAILGANAFLLGLLILIVIVACIAYFVLKRQKQSAKAAKDTWASK